MADTALEVLTEIVEGLGGTTDARTLVPALEDLQELLGTTTLEAYVDAWLDDHPEATTTVEDGAVTTAKLADDAVTAAKLDATVLTLTQIDALF